MMTDTRSVGDQLRAWRDLVVHRPNTMGQDRRDSIGPVRVSGETLYPAAPATAEPTSSGGFQLRGGFWLNNRNKGIQRKATFRYEPTRCGVKQTFPGKRGEVFEMSFFFRDRPTKRGRVLFGPRESVTSSVDAAARSSGSTADGGSGGANT